MEKQNKIKDEIGLRHLSPDFVSLTRNGADLYCPFVSPTAYQQPSKIVGGQPTVGYSRSSCTSLCPLFQILEGGNSVMLNCGATLLHKIDKIIPFQEPKQQGEGKILTINKD